ncbi:MAG: undecaprenyl-diphosphate phosphatase [Ilumatobacteraceae bacterium]|jgi:undecaprenyl-diphosphatase|nr:undecaprenyl-diphosphate phosphatase [Ilumatobacteraceae bacterium]
MPILHAIILGLVQGFSEFLPISSSGHLALVPWLFGWNDFADVTNGASIEKAFDTALHLGTLVAVLFYLRTELIGYVREGIRIVVSPQRANRQMGKRAWLFVASAIPAGIAGAIGQQWITDKLGTPVLIAVSLVFFGLLLLWADRQQGTRDVNTFTRKDALLIGLAQVLALNPGTSRSGITITAARKFGFSRDAAARVSFLMSVPVIGGAVLFSLVKLVRDGIPDGLIAPMIAGIIAAGVSGWVAMWGMIRILRTRNFNMFVMYRVALGFGVLSIAASSWR